MHQVAVRGLALCGLTHRAPVHQAVLGVEGQAAAGDACDTGRVGLVAVAWREQTHIHVEGGQRAAEGGDRRGHAVHARKENVGNHQHPDHGPSMRAACYRAVKWPRRDVIDLIRGASMRQCERLSLRSWWIPAVVGSVESAFPLGAVRS